MLTDPCHNRYSYFMAERDDHAAALLRTVEGRSRRPSEYQTDFLPDSLSDRPWTVTVHLGEVDDRRECVGVEIWAPPDAWLPKVQPVSAAGLRHIPLGRMIEKARRDYAAMLER